MRRTTVVIADRHPIVREGITSVLAAEHDFAIVAACQDGTSCIEAIRRFVPDIAVLELSMPDLSGLEILARVKADNLPTRVVLFTASGGERDLNALIAEGAYGALTKDSEPEMLVRTLREVGQGRTVMLSPGLEQEELYQSETPSPEKPLRLLTERERQIMSLVSGGLSNKEIGRRLNVSEGTIKVHLHHIFQKLDIANRTVLAALAISQHETRITPEEIDSPNSSLDDEADIK
jgi:DNA-binding NarL/FixJ family response regulator